MNSQSEQTVSPLNTSVKTTMKPYAIRWKCTVTGRIGTGTMRFEQEEAECLAKELNEKHPDINHEVVISAPASAKPDVEHPQQP